MRSLRAALRLLSVVLVTVLLLPLAVGSRLPLLVGARGFAMWWGSRIQAGWARLCLLLMGFRLEVRGAPPRERVLIAANHLSYVDILVLGALCPCRFVAKSEIAGWPIIGPLARTVGTLFIHQARRRDLQRVGGEMESTFRAGVSVALFPEGGASRGARIEKLHSSLFEGVVERPIPCWAATLGYRTPDEPWGEAWTVCWWGGMDMWRHLWRLLGLRRVRATVRWREIETADKSRKEIASAVHAALAAGFEPIRQQPVPADCPWPELVALPVPGEEPLAARSQESNAG